MTDHDLPDELLARFLSGEASAVDRVAVETWAASHPDNRAILDRMLAATAPPAAGAWDVDRAWQRTAERIHQPDEPARVLELPRRSWRPALLGLAAAAVVIVAAVIAVQQFRPAPAPVVYATGMGERIDVTLPDGTLAVLGPWTTLTVPAEFGGRHRQVALDGEAWFEASHDSVAFEVAVNDYLVRDIGTQFTVTQRGDAPLNVMVLQGEVQVRVFADTATLLASLTAGDVGSFSRPDTLLEHEAVLAHQQPVASLAAWRHGSLELVDAPVGDVIGRLAAWHGVEITVTSEKSQGKTITATLPLDSLDASLDLIATLLDAEVVRAPGTVRLQ